VLTARGRRAVSEELRAGSGLLGRSGLGGLSSLSGDLGGLGLGSGEELGLPLGQRLGVGGGDHGLLTGAGAAAGAGHELAAVALCWHIPVIGSRDAPKLAALGEKTLRTVHGQFGAEHFHAPARPALNPPLAFGLVFTAEKQGYLKAAPQQNGGHSK